MFVIIKYVYTKVGEYMEIGASSSCFYPLLTEKAFLNIAELGFQNAEIFLNSPSELSMPFIRQLKAVKDSYGVNVVSLHPYRSFSEGYDIFSKYERRFDDVTEVFKRYFDAAATLEAEYIILHGARGKPEIPVEQYAERYFRLSEIASKMGCTLTHENVVNYVGEHPDFMKFMKAALGDRFKMVLDIKQARQSGIPYANFIDEMKDDIVTVHLSDVDENGKMCLPGKGVTDFEDLFKRLHGVGFDGSLIIECYFNDYQDYPELFESLDFVKNLSAKIFK